MKAYTSHPAEKGQFTPFWASRDALRDRTAERKKKTPKAGKKEKTDGIQDSRNR